MLMREKLLVSSRSSLWQNVTVCSSDAIAFCISVAWTAGEVVAHSVSKDVSASTLVGTLTFRQQKSVNFEVGSPTSPRKQFVPWKWVAVPKVQKDVTVSIRPNAKKSRNVRLALLSDDENNDPSYSARTDY